MIIYISKKIEICLIEEKGSWKKNFTSILALLYCSRKRQISPISLTLSVNFQNFQMEREKDRKIFKEDI